MILITGVDGSSVSSVFAFATLLLFVCDGFIVDGFIGIEFRPKNSINSGLKLK